MRDTQRARVYRADDALKPFNTIPNLEVDDVERFVNKVWQSERMKTAFPKAMAIAPPLVKDGRGAREARADKWHIVMPRWSRTSGVTCHELAHTITRREYGEGLAHHGWEFCATYLKIVLYVLGREAHDALKALMKANKVRFTAKRKRVMSEEQKAVLRVRLAQARACHAGAVAFKEPKAGDPGPALLTELFGF